MSACATTAVWCSLQKMRDLEDIASFTPAAITTLASRFSLAHGRMMPAEAGLNIDQMCQAIQGIGASPNLIAIRNIRDAKRYPRRYANSKRFLALKLRPCSVGEMW